MSRYRTTPLPDPAIVQRVYVEGGGVHTLCFNQRGRLYSPDHPGLSPRLLDAERAYAVLGGESELNVCECFKLYEAFRKGDRVKLRGRGAHELAHVLDTQQWERSTRDLYDRQGEDRLTPGRYQRLVGHYARCKAEFTPQRAAWQRTTYNVHLAPGNSRPIRHALFEIAYNQYHPTIKTVMRQWQPFGPMPICHCWLYKNWVRTVYDRGLANGVCEDTGVTCFVVACTKRLGTGARVIAGRPTPQGLVDPFHALWKEGRLIWGTAAPRSH